MQNCDFRTRITNLHRSRTSPVVLVHWKTTLTLASDLLDSMGASPHLWVSHAKLRSLGPELQFSMGPSTSPMFFCIQNSDFSNQNCKSLCVPSPNLWFCAFTTATLWPELIVSMGPRLHLSFCACKTACLAPESLVTMGPRPHLSFCACKTSMISIRITSLYWSQPSFVVFVCKTATLVPELQVSMRPRLHLMDFSHSKLRL